MKIAFSEYLQHGCMFFTYSFTRVRSWMEQNERQKQRTKESRERERERLRRRYLPMKATYIRVMAHVKPERVRQKTVPRGLNRHQGGSVLFYARVFPCTRLPQILRTRTFPLSGSTFQHVCVYVCVSRARQLG